MSIALVAAIVNFAARPISNKTKASELVIKCVALAVVLVCVATLMILGK